MKEKAKVDQSMQEEGFQLSIGSKARPIIVTLSTFQGSPLIDIRRYYVDKKTKELKPTRKGIAFRKENYDALMGALIENKNEIGKCLEHDESDELISAAIQTMKDRIKAREDASRKIERVQVQSDSWRSPIFFEVESSGSTDILRYNTKHRLNEVLLEASFERELVKDILDPILIAYHRARALVDDGSEVKTDEIFAVLEYEWGVILQNYLDQRSSS